MVMKSCLYRGPLGWPRPYSDITQADPYEDSFVKSLSWALYRGFYDWHHQENDDKDTDNWERGFKL